MPNLTVKEIKGNTYLYIKDSVKVNSKSLPVLVYVGRFQKATPDLVLSKLGKLRDLKVTRYLGYRLEHYPFTILDRSKARELEILRYYYERFRELYPDESERYMDAMYLRYVQGSTAIEGNTITLREAQELLDHAISPAGKKMGEVYEILNFLKLRSFLSEYGGDLTEPFIRKVHEIMMEHLLRNPGDYRNIQVGIEKVEYEPPPAILVPDLMKELLQWYRQNRKCMNPFELAVLVHTRFEIIHPFVDGNGRVGRALMNFVLERAGYPTLYLGLEHRSAYLNALVLADGGTVAPIVGTLSDLYLNQHGMLVQEVRNATMDNSPIFKDENEKIVRQLSALKKND